MKSKANTVETEGQSKINKRKYGEGKEGKTYLFTVITSVVVPGRRVPYNLARYDFSDHRGSFRARLLCLYPFQTNCSLYSNFV